MSPRDLAADAADPAPQTALCQTGLWVRGLGASLGGREILRDLSLEAGPGEICVIAGPNGSGKSTLLRCLTGDLAYRGEVRLGGVDPAQLRLWQLAARRAVMAQSTEMAFPFTLSEVVRLGLESGAGGPSDPARIEARIAQALAEVGLEGLGDRRFPELSGGQQQRAHLARVRAQVWDPTGPEGARWLFLDEPVASLDIAHQLQVMEILRNFAAQGGGVVMVMHDLNLTAMVADRLVLMAQGQILAQGPVAQVMTDHHLSQAYGVGLRVCHAPRQGQWLLPQSVKA